MIQGLGVMRGGLSLPFPFKGSDDNSVRGLQGHMLEIFCCGIGASGQYAALSPEGHNYSGYPRAEGSPRQGYKSAMQYP